MNNMSEHISEKPNNCILNTINLWALVRVRSYWRRAGCPGLSTSGGVDPTPRGGVKMDSPRGGCAWFVFIMAPAEPAMVNSSPQTLLPLLTRFRMELQRITE